jgi:serine/threonine protein kinase/Flp pilus assembly protein TadD
MTPPWPQKVTSLLGRQIGAYKILSQLGAGGMGEVYLAYDTRLERTIALKIRPTEVASDSERMRRFVQEAKAASALKHPNVAHIYEIGESDGVHFIAMEYVEGQTIAAKINDRPLDPAQIVEIGIQVADALDEAHTKGITHRDIKPANLMVTPRGQVKVLDFGLAKVTRPEEQTTASDVSTVLTTSPGVMMGTVQYMSPEQALGQEVDHRSDIFSLGIVLYEMAAGRRPFSGMTATEVIDQILHFQPEPVARFSDQVPLELERIVLKCLEKDRGQRYQSAHELLINLSNFKQSMETNAAPLLLKTGHSKYRAVWDRVKRAWIVVLSLVAVFLAVLIAFDIGSLRNWREQLLFPKAIAFAKRDWVVIADFENLTGEEIFDKSLNSALGVSLGQSSYVNVYPRQSIEASLRRMRKEAVQHVDAATARGIAEREGLKLALLPSISGIGGVYALSATIQDPATGASLKSESVRAEGKPEVLKALDQLAKKIRQDLGETRDAVSKQSKPLVQVTTSSLEALKQFSLAVEKSRAGKFDEARQLYEDALRIDPAFTSAKGALGMVQFELFDREKGKALLAQAVQHVEGLTDKEKYNILAFYTSAVQNDFPKAIDYWKSLLALYPDAGGTHNNIGRVYLRMERYEDAAAEFKEAIRIDPYLMVSYFNLNDIYLFQLGDVASALALCKQQIAYNDRDQGAYYHLGWAYWGKDDLEQARVAFGKALEIGPQLTWNLSGLGHTYRLQGRYSEALQTFLKILQVDAKESAAHYDAGAVCQLMGDVSAARKHFESFREDAEKRVRKNPQNALDYLDLARALTRLGQKKHGWGLGQKAMSIDPSKHFEFSLLLCLHGKKQEALDHLDLAVQKGFRNYLWMKIHPDLQTISSESRFQNLTNKVLKK